MNKTNCKTVTLKKGEVSVYDFGNIQLHAYKTNDFLGNEVFIFEKAGKAVVLEPPCFIDNIKELTGYISSVRLNVAAKLTAYHMAGATFMPDVPVYATKNADDYGHSGGGKELITNFTGAFGTAFDGSIMTVTNFIEAGLNTIGGIQMNIVKTPDAFDVEFPEINAVYTHMLGNDCHSIVAGCGHADAIIAQLQGYIAKGYVFVLSSHYTPENLKDVAVKLAYINELKNIAATSANAAAFKSAVKKQYPDYSGENYLDITTGLFFPTNNN